MYLIDIRRFQTSARIEKSSLCPCWLKPFLAFQAYSF